ncbi:MAG: hypothetical protein ACLRX6_03535 [Limosilactobacillus pontis]
MVKIASLIIIVAIFLLGEVVNHINNDHIFREDTIKKLFHKYHKKH